MLKNRFRKYLPVVVDLETGGFDSKENAILEIAITLIEESEDTLLVGETHRFHIKPYEGLVVENESLEFTKINLNHPLRNAVPESHALLELFTIINKAKAKYECSRAILVGHNAHFDLSFLHAAVDRNKINHMPFHRFTCFDTATLGAIAYGQSVLARALKKAQIDFDKNQAHTALYDAQVTAELFCKIANRFNINQETLADINE